MAPKVAPTDWMHAEATSGPPKVVPTDWMHAEATSGPPNVGGAMIRLPVSLYGAWHAPEVTSGPPNVDD